MGHGGRPKAELVLSTEERLALERLANRRKSAQAMAVRARIVMCCAKGDTNRDVAQQLGVSEGMVGKWRRRFVEHRLDGLSDDPRPGAPRTISDDQVEAVIVKTREEKPDDATHWSTRSMAEQMGMSQTTIRRIVLEGPPRWRWSPIGSEALGDSA
jgi:transposase